MKDNKMHMYFVRVASPKIIMPSSDFRVQTLTEVKGGLVVVVDVSDFFFSVRISGALSARDDLHGIIELGYYG